MCRLREKCDFGREERDAKIGSCSCCENVGRNVVTRAGFRVKIGGRISEGKG